MLNILIFYVYMLPLLINIFNGSFSQVELVDSQKQKTNKLYLPILPPIISEKRWQQTLKPSRMKFIYFLLLLLYNYICQTMYALLGSIVTGAACFYVGHNYNKTMQQLSEPVKELKVLPNHTFASSTIHEYTELRKQQNKHILYSKYHKCELSTHQLIELQAVTEISEQKKDENNIQTSNSLNSATNPTNPPITQQQMAQKRKATDPLQKKNKNLVQQFREYGQQLLSDKICNSIELIYGPIFSKDTPYKVNSEVVKNVYTSNIKIGKTGEWLTDRYYAVVVCNRNEDSYLNGFTFRKPNDNKIRFLNYLTSLKKIEEQTGLVFNIQGQQLTLIDYKGIAKQRTLQAKPVAQAQASVTIQAKPPAEVEANATISTKPVQVKATAAKTIETQ